MLLVGIYTCLSQFALGQKHHVNYILPKIFFVKIQKKKKKISKKNPPPPRHQLSACNLVPLTSFLPQSIYQPEYLSFPAIFLIILSGVRRQNFQFQSFYFYKCSPFMNCQEMFKFENSSSPSIRHLNFLRKIKKRML